MAHYMWHFNPLSIPSTKKTQKTLSVGPPLTKLSGSAHDYPQRQVLSCRGLYEFFSYFVSGGMSCDPRVMFKCRSSQGCLPRKLVCSGVKDCADGSDEWGCHADNHTGELIGTHFLSDWTFYLEHLRRMIIR